MANHEKVFGICENKCLVETITKSEFEFLNEKVIQTPKRLTEDAPYIVPESGSYTILAIGGAGGGGGGGGGANGPYSYFVKGKSGSAGNGRSGGAGGKGGYYSNDSGTVSIGGGGQGGAGGFGFISYKSVNLEKGDQITVTLGQVGSGGAGGKAGTETGWGNLVTAVNGKPGSTGKQGGATYVFKNGTKILTANGGKGGAGGGGGSGKTGEYGPGVPGTGGVGGDGSRGGQGGAGGSTARESDGDEFNGSNGLAGKTYTPNSSSEYVSSTDRNPNITWKTVLNVFGYTFTCHDKLTPYKDTGQAFICVNPIEFSTIYPLK